MIKSIRLQHSYFKDKARLSLNLRVPIDKIAPICKWTKADSQHKNLIELSSSCHSCETAQKHNKRFFK